MIRAIAIDDEPNALRVINTLASEISILRVIDTFTNPITALDYLHQHPVDLIFLDIDMPDISGLEFSRSIHKKNVLVIFTTAHSEYAIDSYEVEAVDYLLKPFEFTRFHTAVIKAKERLSRLEKAEGDFFFVSTGKNRTKICYDDICYVEGNGNYVTYHLAHTQVMVRSTIKEAKARLPAADFSQIQRSYVVALKQIDKIQDNHVYLRNAKISIGPNYREAFKLLIDGLS